MYNRSLSDDEVKMLYESNLMKTGDDSWVFNFSIPKENKNYDYFAKVIFGSNIYELALKTINAYTGSTGITSSGGSFGVLTKFLDKEYSSVYSVNKSFNFEIAIGSEQVSENVSKVIKEKHSMTIEKINNDSVILLFQSEPVKIELRVNESKKVDLQEDGVYDILVKLNSIVNSKAYITLTPINELVEEIVNEGRVDEPWKEGKTEEEIKQIEKKSNLTYWIILGILIFILGLISFRFFLKKRKK